MVLLERLFNCKQGLDKLFAHWVSRPLSVHSDKDILISGNKSRRPIRIVGITLTTGVNEGEWIY